MKKLTPLLKKISFSLVMAGILAIASSADAVNEDNGRAPVIRMINFKSCVEQSKMGKQEQAAFEGLKKQMENVLEEKEKVLNDLNSKVTDADYLDSLSPEAETELKRKFRTLSQEIMQLQNQYYQALSQTNMKVLQKLNEIVTKAANKIAQQEKIDIILNEESSFYYSPKLDISSLIITAMDEMFEKDAKDKPAAERKIN